MTIHGTARVLDYKTLNIFKLMDKLVTCMSNLLHMLKIFIYFYFLGAMTH